MGRRATLVGLEVQERQQLLIDGSNTGVFPIKRSAIFKTSTTALEPKTTKNS